MSVHTCRPKPGPPSVYVQHRPPPIYVHTPASPYIYIYMHTPGPPYIRTHVLPRERAHLDASGDASVQVPDVKATNHNRPESRDSVSLSFSLCVGVGVCVYVSVCVSVCVSVSVSLSLFISLYIYIYTYTYMYIYICVYMLVLMCRETRQCKCRT